jgi:hypothetical protein
MAGWRGMCSNMEVRANEAYILDERDLKGKGMEDGERL